MPPATYPCTCANIKKTDAVIVGMFQQYQDEVALNAEFTRKYGQVQS